MLPNLRRIFASFRTEKEERSYSRTAFVSQEEITYFIHCSLIVLPVTRKEFPKFRSELKIKKKNLVFYDSV
ncbi:fungal protein [Schizosaccharomyces cryophilus OY26]|uniref:Fungal protein n=1 Tax=Schizosaccharomyces cryophilus (strain OY26 / ATCC MYA-4695 / CBS 11777 / NBRC 106824 / NRRL Y48691) TaxID=653667 RepID=S9XH44_SCHCR|nr:uncharacterized protein SPOG_04719 [Schizosaccharomyces cryophilus OY26]EPY52991.1 fungal protein [Schizosaccharomyces cryophilus OY26]